jgi:hypothetical protein
MPTKTQGTTQAGTIKAYEDKIKAQVAEAKSRLDLLEATAREKKAHAEITAIAGLKTTKENIDRRIRDLKTTSDANLSRAKAAIESDVASFKTSVDGIAAKIKTRATTK